MDIEQAIEELERYAADFASIGDATEFRKNNEKEFLHKFSKVNQYYKYIIERVDESSEQWLSATGLVYEITVINSSLEKWVNQILGLKKQQRQSNEEFDTTSFVNTINSYVFEIQNMQYWDPNKAEEIKWGLEGCEKRLIANKKFFEPEVYKSLIEDIHKALNKIDSYNNMINSTITENITRM